MLANEISIFVHPYFLDCVLCLCCSQISLTEHSGSSVENLAWLQSLSRTFHSQPAVWCYVAGKQAKQPTTTQQSVCWSYWGEGKGNKNICCAAEFGTVLENQVLISRFLNTGVEMNIVWKCTAHPTAVSLSGKLVKSATKIKYNENDHQQQQLWSREHLTPVHSVSSSTAGFFFFFFYYRQFQGMCLIIW